MGKFSSENESGICFKFLFIERKKKLKVFCFSIEEQDQIRNQREVEAEV